ncbi:hypothetical protein EDD37DRAFT_670678 [Exophiala viscosa]|uniref:uncharacterized protein n=1 Tax=Exophiala viscosa TaxID=2486360 RepID=UPI0021A2031F|nr:hypothetical protein EDD37DRAFT_670678 [Exophiala viscosa]
MTYHAHVFAWAITPSILAGIAVISRCVTRFELTNTLGVEEIIIVVAALGSAGLATLICLEVDHGFQDHEILPPSDYVYQLKILYAGSLLYQTALYSVKASILCQCLKLFSGRYRTACAVALTFITVYAIAAFTVDVFACWPIHKFWMLTVPGKCIELSPIWYITAAVQITTDLVVCLLPISVFKPLKLPKLQKYSLILVFALGGVGCVCSMIRLVRLHQILEEPYLSRKDVSVALWSSLEVNLGIICACLPNLRRPLSRLFPKFFRNTGSESSDSSGNKMSFCRLWKGTKWISSNNSTTSERYTLATIE